MGNRSQAVDSDVGCYCWFPYPTLILYIICNNLSRTVTNFPGLVLESSRIACSEEKGPLEYHLVVLTRGIWIKARVEVSDVP